MIAVGVGNYKLEELRLFATDPSKHVSTVDTFDHLVGLVKTLRQKACDGRYRTMLLRKISLSQNSPVTLTMRVQQTHTYSHTSIQPYSIQPYSYAAAQPYSHRAIEPYSIQPYSYAAAQPYSHRAIEP